LGISQKFFPTKAMLDNAWEGVLRGIHSEIMAGLDAAEAEVNPMFTLVSVDGVMSAQVSRNDAKLSKFICVVLENEPDATGVEVPFQGSTLRQVAMYLSHHNGKPAAPILKPLRSSRIQNVVEDSWDSIFIRSIKTWKDLWELMKAADYLDIHPLLQLAAAFSACHMKGKTKDELIEMYAAPEIPEMY
jgi:hypothetical protein